MNASIGHLLPHPATSLVKAQQRLASLQLDDGSWEAEVVWSPVITAQAVIVQAIVGQIASEQRRRLILHYFSQTRRPDGGWGLHPESRSYVFVTTVVYIAARLLGASPQDKMIVSAREFLAANPHGVHANPQWGLFWLALIGLYDRHGLNPCPPELFLLPRSSPLSPLRFYCHTRYIYLAMAYLSGSGFQANLGPLTNELRNELPGLAGGPPSHKVPVAPSDLHEPPGRVLSALYGLTRGTAGLWRALPGTAALRKRALSSVIDRIRYEQRATGYQGLSPVSGLLNTLALFARDPSDTDVAASLDGVEAWCWSDEENGLRYAGARSTAWDTSFALQALVEEGPDAATRHMQVIRRGYARLCAMQAVSDPPDRIAQDRDINLGGWCFTEGTQAWPVSDCTAEAVIALLDCHAIEGLIEPQNRISGIRLPQAADFILSRQNQDGGFGSYERRRGQAFLERLNPSEMFGRCMTELTYVECTSSSIRALSRILGSGAPVDRERLTEAIRQGTEIVLSRQQQDGSWPGFWGINFVYGTLFALTALRDIGLPVDHPAILRARAWLEARQKPDGGWGEHFDGCASGTYVDNPRSLVITTAWATLALLCTANLSLESARRGGAWLESSQLANGDWPRDSVNGVFFGTAMLDYRLYNTYFPVMALAKLARHASA
ncbi:prenyltransferase/squalene oxidase repeat-containing protein [Lichenifustis flavocetrariae]|uniref:Terpene cyclase/mutase family member n=1 Tax=Lichenifustis flavocetrariae TaxID=2949735 RepID=A0AA41Z3E2_9HYPH|nr:prenyltransferase/squalene oxidase repeat-containing protein [Lichenifustis flavocetrariae]MCW6509773.1 hypothetical protein [Lichenifustis flavocetrariae]